MENTYIPQEYRIPELRIGKLILSDIEISIFSDRPFPRERLIIGFMGPAGKQPDASGKVYEPTLEEKELGERVGKIIAAKGAIISNGAVWGLPYFPI